MEKLGTNIEEKTHLANKAHEQKRQMLSNTHQIKLEKIFRFQSWVFEYGNMVISMSVSFGMRSKY